MIRALVVDDEPLARLAVTALLKRHDDVDLVGEAGDGATAVALITELRPDLVFLDVQMPDGGGFEVIEEVGVEAMPITVFVTAHDEHALRAFEVHALDYLLKPFDDQRFDAVVQRIRRQLGAEALRPDIRSAMLDLATRPLLARSRGATRLIPLQEISWISSAGDYAEVHTSTGTFLVNDSLSTLENRLRSSGFARVHRSTIVRLDRIAVVQTGSHGDAHVRLSCGRELRISRRYRDAIDGYAGQRPA